MWPSLYNLRVTDRAELGASRIPEHHHRPWWLLLAFPALLLWVLIACLGFIEIEALVRESETEHSPLLVMAFLVPPAALVTWMARAIRQRARRYRCYLGAP